MSGRWELVGETLDPASMIQRVADQALELVATADGVLVGVSNAAAVTYLCGAGHLSGHVGASVALQSSLAGLAVRSNQILRSDDSETDPRVDLEACRRLSVASSVCVPLRRAGRTVGVLAVSAARAYAFDDRDVALLRRLAGFVGVVVGLAGDLAQVRHELLVLGEPAPAGPSPGRSPDPLSREGVGRFMASVLTPHAVALVEARRRIVDLLEHPETVNVVFQPIVEVATGHVVGAEALARFQTEPVRTPDLWFAEAHTVGLGVELELAAVANAVAYRKSLPQEIALSVNVGPECILSPQLADVIPEAAASGLVLELTEHNAVEDYPDLAAALARFRSAGAALAVDDTGAGISSLSHILKLAPDFIKLDRDLVRGIDIDPVRRALAAALVGFAGHTGARLIAEGVETADELSTLAGLGVGYAQGFHLAVPGPLDAVLRRAGAGDRPSRLQWVNSPPP